jgi:DNA helicase II / ATP-dependent DNA helicase PcrA
VRRRSPLLNEKLLASLGTDQLAQLTKAKAGADALMHLWDGGAAPTFQDVLNSVGESKLFTIPDALLGFTGQKHNDQGVAADTLVEDEDELTEQEKELTAWRESLVTPFNQISAYVEYVTGKSRFGTHQGVKGLEFPRVMVVISDDEAKGFLFSYEKLFGAKAKSTTDIKHESSGEETTIDRTRRLFYVTCSRAESSLAIVAYSQNPDVVKRQVIQEGWFEESEVITF